MSNGNGQNTPICRYLQRLTSGDDVDYLIVGGRAVPVDAFVNFEEETGISTFVQGDGSVVIMGCDSIDGLIIEN